MFEVRGASVVDRVFTRRDGTKVRSPMGAYRGEHEGADAGDAAWLRADRRPPFSISRDGLVAVDLFSGCGGLSLGLAEACRATGHSISKMVGVDAEAVPLEIYRANIPAALTVAADVSDLFDGGAGRPGDCTGGRCCGDARIAGVAAGGASMPGFQLPQQPHPRRRSEERPLLPRRPRGRGAAAGLGRDRERRERPPGRDLGAAAKTAAHLRGLGYSVDDAVLPVLRLGVAQGRRRHVLLASRAREVSLEAVLESFGGPARTLQWAIGDLAPARRRRPFDSASKPSPTNRRRMDWLRRAEAYDLPNERRPECHADGDHTYKSMYGRLRWDLPAQTITSGYGSMGQGRMSTRTAGGRSHPTRRPGSSRSRTGSTSGIGPAASGRP